MSEQRFGFRIKWLGCACFEMDFGEGTFVNDPYITDNAATELTWESVEKCDYITVTHAHFDHITDIPALVEKYRPYILCGEATAWGLMKWGDLNPLMMYPMSPDQELDFDFVKVKALYGRHVLRGGPDATLSSLIERGRNMPALDGRPDLLELVPCGEFEYRNFLYTLPNGTKILIWGNRLDRPDQRNILRQARPDIAIMQMTTNSAADTVTICKEMGCKVLIPNHIDVPKGYMERVLEVKDELEKRAPEIRYIIPEYGEWISL